MRKPFQDATVRWAVDRLSDPRGSGRALVADEVGLGKTFVAQGVIDTLASRHKGDEPFRVFYVCSSLSIAAQNEERIRAVLPQGERERARVHAGRISQLLNVKAPSPPPRFLLYTLTPGTSMLPGTGLVNERATLARCVHELLFPSFDERSLGWFHEAFRVSVGKDVWCGHWKQTEPPTWFDKDFRDRFYARLQGAFPRSREFGMEALDLRLFVRLLSEPHRKAAVARLRAELNLSIVERLRPDLIVFDEFQRFFEVLPRDREATEAEEQVDGREAQAREVVAALLRQSMPLGERTRVLMLSATPFRMYARALEAQQHHQEFYELLRFLHADRGPAAAKDLRRRFEAWRERLERDPVGSEGVLTGKADIERSLRQVIARSERAALLGAAHAPSTIDAHRVELRSDEVMVYRHLLESCGEGHQSAAEAFWSSVPLPLQMMPTDYTFRRDARPAARRSGTPQLRMSELRRYGASPECAHARLRGLLEVLPADVLSLPWLPPSRPWWPLEAPFTPPDGGWSKALVFSRFRAVPRALATMLSYEAERRALAPAMRRRRHGSFDWSTRGAHGAAAAKKDPGRAGKTELRRLPPLAFTLEQGPQWCARIAMFLPWPTLASTVDPLALASTSTPALTFAAAVAHARAQITAKLGCDPERSQRAPAWTWLVRLEERHGGEAWRATESCIRAWRKVPSAARVFDPPADGAARPGPRELDELAEIAVAGMGPALLRAANRVFGQPVDGERRAKRIRALLRATEGLRTYLDRPEWHVAFEEHFHERHHRAAAARRAAWAGNLEAVFDEFLAIEQGLGRTAPSPECDEDALDALRVALSLRETGLAVLSAQADGKPMRLRSHAAVAYGIATTADEEPVTGSDDDLPARADHVRAAFNSPFRPMVLVTTSIGQEGLDFHRWSRHLVHWDLPDNPVDLEQRDGRLRRHGGLAVRQAMAAALRGVPLDPSRSPWHAAAERFPDDPARHGLTPWWHVDGAAIRRTLLVASFSEQEARCRRLQSELDLYRLAIGQPDQEQLIARLQGRLEQAGGVDAATLRAWFQRATIDLRPR